MRWFTIKREVEDMRSSQVASQVTVASIRNKLKNYQSIQGPSEFIGPAMSIEDSLSLSEITGSVDYIKVEVDPENAELGSEPGRVPFSIH